MYPEIIENKRYKRQIINFITVNQYLKNKSLYGRRAAYQLKELGVKTSNANISQVMNNISNGRSRAEFPSIFNNKLSPRTGKDESYAAFWRLGEIFLDNQEWKYVGLPAHNIEIICSNIIGNPSNVTACELSPDTYNWMNIFYFKTKRRRPIIINQNIFNFLNETQDKFNVFDFDLCNGIRSNIDFNKWAALIYRTSEDRSIINISSMIGRRCGTEKEYREIMPQTMTEALYKGGFNIVKNYNDGYTDRVPMRYCHYVVFK